MWTTEQLILSGETLSTQGKADVHTTLMSLRNIIWGLGPHAAAAYTGWRRPGSGLGAGDREAA